MRNGSRIESTIFIIALLSSTVDPDAYKSREKIIGLFCGIFSHSHFSIKNSIVQSSNDATVIKFSYSHIRIFHPAKFSRVASLSVSEIEKKKRFSMDLEVNL